MGTVHTLRSIPQASREELAILQEMAEAERAGDVYPCPYERDKRTVLWRLYDACAIAIIVRQDEAPALCFSITRKGRQMLDSRITNP